MSGAGWQLWEEHVFALTQAVELYDVYQTKVRACDIQIEVILKRLKKNSASPKSKLLPTRQRRQPSTHAGHFMLSSEWTSPKSTAWGHLWR